jgi:hypothetical protein
MQNQYRKPLKLPHRNHPALHHKLGTSVDGQAFETSQVKSMRPDKVKRHIKKFDDGFGYVVVRIPECGYREHPSLAGPLVGQ